jgi:hypothetical protein
VVNSNVEFNLNCLAGLKNLEVFFSEEVMVYPDADTVKVDFGS